MSLQPIHHLEESSDYRTDPTNSHSENGGFGDLEAAFCEHARQGESSGSAGNGEPISKTAGAYDIKSRSAHANPIDDVYDQHVRLMAMEEKLASAYMQFHRVFETSKEDLHQHAKMEILNYDGSGMAGVVEATKLASPSDNIAFAILKPLTERLVHEGIV